MLKLKSLNLEKRTIYMINLQFCFSISSDEVGIVPAVEGERLNIKCDYSDATKINKVQWTKETMDDTQSDYPNILSKKSQWYVQK